MKDKIVDHEDQVILTKESYKSTNVSMNESMNIDNPIPSLFLQCLYKLQGLSLQYLYEAVITTLCLRYLYENTSIIVHLLLSLVQVSIQMSICEDILYHLYKRISTVMLLLVSLRTSLLDEFLQPSLLMSLRSGILHTFILDEFLQPSLLMSLRSGILQPSLLTSL